MPDVMDLWRTIRAELIARGIKCPVAETEATAAIKAGREANVIPVMTLDPHYLAKVVDAIARRLKRENPAG